MSPYEREYFVSRLRTGFYIINDGETKIKVVTPTVEQEYESNEVFMDSYNRCVADGFLTEDEMLEWMIEKGLWSEDKQNQFNKIEKDIESFKVELFQNRSKEAERERIRKILNGAKTLKAELSREKEEYFSNTCEGIALNDKNVTMFEWCCLVDGEPYKFPNDNAFQLYFMWISKILREHQVRELARTDPWSSFWALRGQGPLFKNKEQLTIDQKNILIWSQMYDNIQESMDCPPKSVIEDDDMLDGWMILQRQKSESEKAKSELETKMNNSKIAQSDEVFIFTDNKKDAQDINDMNSFGAKKIKQQRMALISSKGEAQDLDFKDQKIRVSNMQNEKFKGRFGGR
jgi:hypothetical protein